MRKAKGAVAGKGGFTLVETLIAAAIIAIIGSMIFGSFNAVLGAGRGMEERAELYHTARFIIRKLGEDMASAVMYQYNTQGYFAGKNEKVNDLDISDVRFTGFGRRIAAADSGTDQAQIIWYATPNEKDKKFTLVRSENPYVYDLEASKEMAEAMEVTANLKSFRVRYYNAAGQWVESYDSRKTGGITPKEVEVEFSLEDGEGRSLTKRALIPVGGKS